ncbi:hypothetical protein PTSG_08008 [Salpingoeca rosetta]|uniref:RRM domain-containing protein n=1 Tax=Salpingoeca rosetta (strain ATCC 50818 / BSB-021) TaxID=946362 RepID=F2UHQ9_SALR5|nr:uncharacterized protein PTSG_08008 [Salpingoeca rosetta]EGD76658.1 hypothetical protein PTSG_08008 [Salpingoeca rosetta]|eukprot:XP_004991030.1 hypothetical protein PTSG_08008 [Salpingoeca rosetta]
MAAGHKMKKAGRSTAKRRKEEEVQEEEEVKEDVLDTRESNTMTREEEEGDNEEAQSADDEDDDKGDDEDDVDEEDDGEDSNNEEEDEDGEDDEEDDNDDEEDDKGEETADGEGNGKTEANNEDLGGGLFRNTTLSSTTSKDGKKHERGIIYLSTIPPYMKPAKLRHIMSKFGEVDRIFLQPEDPKIRKRRMERGGSKKTNFSEGWVEFIKKKTAKKVAAMLNGSLVGGKKNNFHHDFLWNMKYLPKFKWHHLQERMEYEKASRRYRLRAEMARMQQQTTAYLQQVHAAKRLSRAIARGVAQHDAKKTSSSSSSSSSRRERGRSYRFRQREPITKRAKTDDE